MTLYMSLLSSLCLRLRGGTGGGAVRHCVVLKSGGMRLVGVMGIVLLMLVLATHTVVPIVTDFVIEHPA